MKPKLFYQKHLDQVSRSFAFCIARLEDELRLWVSMSYLLCRLLDTVEDAPWSEASLKRGAFMKFESFMKKNPDAQEVRDWAMSFSDQIPQSEKDLLSDAFYIFEDFHLLPSQVQKKILRGVLNMSRGMEHFSAPGELRLSSLAEVNQYCFFVAGVVGEILTDLLSERISFHKNKDTLLLSHHFGLFLQKINLLKDQMGDEREGRFLVPSRSELLKSLKRDAQGALKYIQSIPVNSGGYRLFCAWSLFLGIFSLLYIENSWVLQIAEKIPRAVTQKVLSEVESIVDDNEALEILFNKNFHIKDDFDQTEENFSDLNWFPKIYEGSLDRNHLADLGMLPLLD